MTGRTMVTLGSDPTSESEDLAVHLHGVGKRFPKSRTRVPSQSLRGLIGRHKRADPLVRETGRARSWALRDVKLSIAPGEILGFIGPNGAGKTTLIKLMSGLITPSEGEIEVLGEKLGRHPIIPDGIGLVAEHQSFIPYLSGYRNLKMLAGLRAVATDHDVAETLRLVGLDPRDRRATKSYSLGMKQRLGLAQALMEKPRLLLLDEPTNGLDPAGVVWLRELLRHLADEGVAIFLASHLLTEVERICDKVLLVADGTIVSEIEQRDAVRHDHHSVLVTLESERDLELAIKWCEAHDVEMSSASHDLNQQSASASTLGGMSLGLVISTEMSNADMIEALVKAGVRIESVVNKKLTLEDQYMRVMQNSG